MHNYAHADSVRLFPWIDPPTRRRKPRLSLSRPARPTTSTEKSKPTLRVIIGGKGKKE